MDCVREQASSALEVQLAHAGDEMLARISIGMLLLHEPKHELFQEGSKLAAGRGSQRRGKVRP